MQSATRGTVNGIGQTLGSLGRSVGPLIGTPLFAWSESNGTYNISMRCIAIVHINILTIIGHGWPLNYHFIYDVTALMVVIIILISFALPKASETKRSPDPVKLQPTCTATVAQINVHA